MIVILINRLCLIPGPLSVSPISLEKHFDIWLSSHLNASKSPFLQSCQDFPRFTKHHASCQIITLAPDRQKQRTLSPISPHKTKLIVCIDHSLAFVSKSQKRLDHLPSEIYDFLDLRVPLCGAVGGLLGPVFAMFNRFLLTCEKTEPRLSPPSHGPGALTWSRVTWNPCVNFRISDKQ